MIDRLRKNTFRKQKDRDLMITCNCYSFDDCAAAGEDSQEASHDDSCYVEQETQSLWASNGKTYPIEANVVVKNENPKKESDSANIGDAVRQFSLSWLRKITLSHYRVYHGAAIIGSHTSTTCSIEPSTKAIEKLRSLCHKEGSFLNHSSPKSILLSAIKNLVVSSSDSFSEKYLCDEISLELLPRKVEKVLTLVREIPSEHLEDESIVVETAKKCLSILQKGRHYADDESDEQESFRKKLEILESMVKLYMQEEMQDGQGNPKSVAEKLESLDCIMQEYMDRMVHKHSKHRLGKQTLQSIILEHISRERARACQDKPIVVMEEKQENLAPPVESESFMHKYMGKQEQEKSKSSNESTDCDAISIQKMCPFPPYEDKTDSKERLLGDKYCDTFSFSEVSEHYPSHKMNLLKKARKLMCPNFETGAILMVIIVIAILSAAFIAFTIRFVIEK
ncbi:MULTISPECIES: hypothetical protein [Candidatus Ichthyocystis]|uniref:Putative membrane protein n=1 Tax=Candidatus Ichthyocystis hellenicum TaxID=1561003 RepID=A0A0S4M1X9_9BURK|nr:MULTISPECIES: hypothetical protein [Ichthyocystis]CUT17023.1 putative membrane protein [Candidatus Ichthyocystis hellenicum]